jgi:hypothetical protein
MRLRRAGLASLLVALFAVAGASVAPTQALSGIAAATVVWQARDERPAPVARQARRRATAGAAIGAPHTSTVSPGVPQAPVRHALFQRPPPTFLPHSI